MGTPTKYQTRRQSIEAIQFDGTKECAERIKVWSADMAKILGPYNIKVITAEGLRIAKSGDWIIKDSGGFWACDDEVFQRKYEAV